MGEESKIEWTDHTFNPWTGCTITGTAFFMKQMGGTRKPFAPIPDDLNIQQFPAP